MRDTYYVRKWFGCAIGLLSAGMMFAGSLPKTVDSVSASVTNGTDLLIAWNEVATDVYGQSLPIDRYRVYRSGNPLFVPDQSLFSNLLAETSNTFLVVTNVMIEVSNTFYYVTAVAADNREAGVFTQLIGHVVSSIPCAPDGQGFFLLSLPYDMPWTNAAGLAGQLAPAIRLSRLNPVTSGFETWDCHASTGVNFTVQGGDVVGVDVTNACVLHTVGLQDARTRQWSVEASASRQRWFSLPAQTLYTNAAQVAAAVGTASKVARWDATNGLYRSWFRLAQQWRGENFAVVSGEGLYVSLRTNAVWRPALPYPKVSVTVSQAMEFVESARGLQAVAQATDDENDLVQYRWDYDGDGLMDAEGSTPVLSYATTLTNAATWYPSLWVRDRRGFLGFGHARYQTLSLALSMTNQLIQPALGQTGTIGYTSSTNGAFTTTIRDEQGNVLRVLESNVWHEVGHVALTWDGCDSTGGVAVGVHYVVVEQRIGTNTATYHPALLRREATGPAGGISIPATLDLRAGGSFPIQYTLVKPAFVTMRIVNSAYETLSVVCTNVPRLAGLHVEYWNGRLADGSLIGAEQTFSVEMDAFVMSDNVLVVEKPLPRIENLTPSLNRFMPALNPYSDEPNSVTLSYRLAFGADVRMEVRASDGRVVRSVLDADQAAGIRQMVWSGTNNDGLMVAEGYYSIELRAESGDACGEPARTWVGVYY